MSAETRGAAILRQAYLKSEIERFRLLPIALSDDSDLVAGLTGSQAALRALDGKLEALARTTGAAQIYVLDASGRTVASSNWGSERSFVGQDYSFRNYFKLAAAHGSGAQFALGTISERPGMYLSRRSRGGGYVVVKLEFDGIEQQWARLGEITFITSHEGIILITSRPTAPPPAVAIGRGRRTGLAAQHADAVAWRGKLRAHGAAGDPAAAAAARRRHLDIARACPSPRRTGRHGRRPHQRTGGDGDGPHPRTTARDGGARRQRDARRHAARRVAPGQSPGIAGPDHRRHRP
ncbi:hypothetical protein [Sphingobium sp. IP1]|uniref:cache domain-containing protein n=1 Tax=Sphingobium sp. IP1 TaxID=2021637 RepID=UPI00211F3088|nr:hypothetical protein [Sphingobium sp. IP1]